MALIIAAHIMMGGGLIEAGCMLIRSAAKMGGSIDCFRPSGRLKSKAERLAGWACIIMGTIIMIAPILAP